MSEVKKVSLLLLLVSYFAKSLIYSNGLSDAAVLLVLGAIYCFCEYKTSDKQLKLVQNQLLEQEKQVKILQDKVDSIKIVQHMQPRGIGVK